MHTNLIEAAWSAPKRWLRARHGGMLPRLAQGDRENLRLLIDEYSFFRLLREAGADGRGDNRNLLAAEPGHRRALRVRGFGPEGDLSGSFPSRGVPVEVANRLVYNQSPPERF